MLGMNLEPYVSQVAWEHLKVLSKELDEVPVDKEIWASLLQLLPWRAGPRHAEENAWMGIFYYRCGPR